VSFQANAGIQGRVFEDAVVAMLSATGWTILGRRWIEPSTGVEVDIVAADPTGRRWWIECKGSWLSESGRNGCLRTDTVKKFIGSAAILAQAETRAPYLLVTSHLPTEGTRSRLWLDLATDAGYVDRIEVMTTFATKVDDDNGGTHAR
jgi:Holliday junction resolvase-like predicted endonuclease